MESVPPILCVQPSIFACAQEACGYLYQERWIIASQFAAGVGFQEVQLGLDNTFGIGQELHPVHTLEGERVNLPYLTK